jgi:hypothetical protein
VAVSTMSLMSAVTVFLPRKLRLHSSNIMLSRKPQ